MNYFVYILTNTHNNVFYVGVSNNLERRLLSIQTLNTIVFADATI
ncbi:GIY-YIG nuclease family protein [Aliikangiella marina]